MLLLKMLLVGAAVIGLAEATKNRLKRHPLRLCTVEGVISGLAEGAIVYFGWLILK